MLTTEMLVTRSNISLWQQQTLLLISKCYSLVGWCDVQRDLDASRWAAIKPCLWVRLYCCACCDCVSSLSKMCPLI